MKAWTEEAKRKARPVDAAELPGRDDAWWAAVYRQPAWKAPGPDGVCAYWYRAFPGLCEQVKDVVWNLIDGDEEVQGWFVKGRKAGGANSEGKSNKLGGECIVEPNGN